MSSRSEEVYEDQGFGQHLEIIAPLALLIVDFPDEQAVEQFLDQDPYFTSGLFANRTVKVLRPVRVARVET